MKSQFESEAEKLVASLRAGSEEHAARLLQVAEFVATLRPAEHELETERQAVQANLESVFAGSWTPSRQGVALTTSFSERTKATTGPESEMLAIQVNDLGFDADPPVYRVQLMGAAIRALAEILTGHEPGSHPTAEFLSCAADLTRHIQQRSDIGRIPGRFILDCEQYGLSSFESYLTASVESDTGTIFATDLDKWTGRVTAGIEAQFVADGGPLAIVDDDALQAELTDDEHNQIGQFEAAGPGHADEINAILATAAHRATSGGDRLTGVAR